MTTAPAVPSPLLIDIRDLAGLLSRSVPSLERDQAAGRLPDPVRIGRSKFWRKAEVEAWVAAGCPDRARWAAVRVAS
jgi:predicted DNA-binding transcriptional regulator AlpA